MKGALEASLGLDVWFLLQLLFSFVCCIFGCSYISLLLVETVREWGSREFCRMRGNPEGMSANVAGFPWDGSECRETPVRMGQNCAGFPRECSFTWLLRCTYGNKNLFSNCWRMLALVLLTRTVFCYRFLILFQRVETCLKLFQNYFRGLLQLKNIFEHVQCRWNNSEIISEHVTAV